MGVRARISVPVVVLGLAGAAMLAFGGLSVGAAGAPVAASAASESHDGTGLGSLPVSAQAPVSAVIGADSSAFAAQRSRTGYRLRGGGVMADLAGGAIRLRSRGASVSIAVSGVGRGGTLEPAPVSAVAARGNRVSLVRSGLTEWYAAGPLGIEQGFTVLRRPAGMVGPVTLALGLAKGLRVQSGRFGSAVLESVGSADASVRGALGG